jgi:hypothetical protein
MPGITDSIVRYYKEYIVSETGCFRPQVKGWEAPTPFGTVDRANLSHWPMSI